MWENAILVLIGASAFVLAGNAHARGIQQKWTTALFGTLVPFCLAIFLHRRSLRWPFWFSLTICLGVHLTAVWVIFQFVLASITNFSILFWLPVMLIEAFILLVAVKKLENKLTGKSETVKLSF